jgi:hypothetical protein
MGRPQVKNRIADLLGSFPKGSILFVDDFLDYGNPESVKKALLRLKEKGILVPERTPHLLDDPRVVLI